jgi:signal transduction histidine kinase
VMDEQTRSTLSPRLLPVSLRVGAVVTFIFGLVAALYRWFPDMAARGAPDSDAVGPVLADRMVVGGRLLAGIALLGAAWAFDRRWRRGGDELLCWLATAAILAGFARIHAFIYPVTGHSFITTAHGFRLVSSIVLAAAVSREILRHWEARAERAVLDERRRIANDLHTGMGNLAYITAQSRWLRKKGHVPDGALSDLAEAAEAALCEARRAIRNLTERPEAGQLHDPSAAAAAAAAHEAIATVAAMVETDAERLERELITAGDDR